MANEDDKKLIKRKRAVALCSFAALLCVIAFLTYFLAVRFSKIAASGVEFREFIQGYGAFGIFIAVFLQIIQVLVALIPGEIIEVGMGYAYGWLGGTMVCLVGVALGSALIFLLVKKFGIKFIELFVSVNKINELRFINNERKLHRLTFILFLIPGTPKDLLTYFIGLTRMTLSEFLTITLFARIPSVVSSTIGGNLIEGGHYIKAVVLFVVTAIISFIGIKVHDIIIKKIKTRAEKGKLAIKKAINNRKNHKES